MPLNKTKAERRAQRRRRVAQLLVRRPRITVREIRRALRKDGHYNPETDEAWSVGTIQSDVETVREKAQEQMKDSADEWRAKEIRKLRQLEQEAWDDGNRELVLRCMKRRSNLLGLDEPDEVEHSGEFNVESDTLDDVMETLTDRATRLGEEEDND